MGTLLRLLQAPLWASIGTSIVTAPFSSPPTRKDVSGFLGDVVADGIQQQIDRINNAYGYQQFLNGGGFHR